METRHKKYKLCQSDIPLTDEQKRTAELMAARFHPFRGLFAKPAGRKIANAVAAVHDWEEVESAAWFGLLDAARTYDQSRNVKPETWAWYKVYDKVRYLIRYKKCVQESIHAHASIYMEDELGQVFADQIPDQIPDQLTTLIADEYRQKITPRVLGAIRGLSKTDREVIRLRYGLAPDGECHSFAQIAKAIGITEMWAWRSHNRIVETLRKKLSDCNND